MTDISTGSQEGNDIPYFQMDSNCPRVTLGLPVYNGAKYLNNVLTSILNQSFRDFELIISDNASSDETEQICRGFAERDGRITYRRNLANIGLAANHNLLIHLSRGKYFKWVAHDDEYRSSMLERCVETIDAAPSTVTAVYTQCEKIDEFGDSLGVASDSVGSDSEYSWCRLSHFLLNASIYNFTYGLVRSEILRKTSLHGLFPIADRVLFAELAMLGELREIREPLLKLRLHPGRSLRAYRTPQAVRELFDPSLAGKKSLLSLEGRAYAELIRCALKTPKGLINKIMCFGVAVLLPPGQRFRNFGGHWKQRLLSGVKGPLRLD